MVISSLGGGGAERVMVDLCRFLNDAGRDVTLLTLSGNDTDAYQVPPGVHRERMEIRKEAHSLFDSLRFSLHHLRAMRGRIVSLRPDIVVSFVEQTNVRVIACLLGTRIPVVVSERVHPGSHKIAQTWNWGRRLLYRRSVAVVVQTEAIAEWFSKSIRTSRLVVIPNAVRSSDSFPSLRSVEQTSLNGPYVLAVGRLVHQKGFDLLIEAFRRSELAQLGWKLVILGEGDQRPALIQQAKAAGIYHALQMPGHVDNVGPWLEKAEIFALSSRYEGFPNALIEAMQLGRAVVSFDCPSGPSDVIQHGQNGLLVPAEDVDALASALERLGHDHALRLRLGSAATGVNERFSQVEIYGRWLRLIDDAVAG